MSNSREDVDDDNDRWVGSGVGVGEFVRMVSVEDTATSSCC